MRVTVKLLGGLGNQMFQYAVGITLADRHGVDLSFDVTAFNHDNLRRYELDVFNIRASIATSDDIAGFNRRVTGVQDGMLCIKSAPTVYQERSFAFDPQVLDLPPPVRLDGYWQSERYFSLNAKALRGDFTLRHPLSDVNKEMLARIHDCSSVSVHVRRGDYVSNPATNGFHGVLGVEYYRRAAACVSEQVERPHFFVFSDDQQWVTDNLDLGHPTTFVKINNPDQGYADMLLMSSCSHHIIANSSFSWWGAWLNASPQKVVVAPKRWFKVDSCDTRDLFPEGWIPL